MISISITSDAQALLGKLGRFPAEMAQGIAGALDRQNMETLNYVSVRKLRQRGPTTLGVVSSRLRSSIRITPAQVVNSSHIVSAIGSNVKYAAVHEYGIDQQVQVRAHSRAITQVFGRPLRDPRTVQVRAHSMHLRFPARAPFRTSAEERQQNYGQAISAAILTAWKTGPIK